MYNTFLFGQNMNKYQKKGKKNMYDKLKQCFMDIRQKTDFKPEIAVVLGSGLGDFADEIDVKSSVDYSNITYSLQPHGLHSTPGLPVHHQFPEFTQTHVH